MRKVILALSLAALCAGPAAAKKFDPDLRPPVIVGENSGPVKLAVGQLLEIRLQMQGGTGYSWDEADPPPFIEFVGQHTLHPFMGEGMPGASQTVVFIYRAVGPGQGEIQLAYRRPWEGGTPPARMVRLPVTVGPWLY